MSKKSKFWSRLLLLPISDDEKEPVAENSSGVKTVTTSKTKHDVSTPNVSVDDVRKEYEEKLRVAKDELEKYFQYAQNSQIHQRTLQSTLEKIQREYDAELAKHRSRHQRSSHRTGIIKQSGDLVYRKKRSKHRHQEYPSLSTNTDQMRHHVSPMHSTTYEYDNNDDDDEYNNQQENDNVFG